MSTRSCRHVSVQNTTGCFPISGAFQFMMGTFNGVTSFALIHWGFGLWVGPHDFSKSFEKWLKNTNCSLKMGTNWYTPILVLHVGFSVVN